MLNSKTEDKKNYYLEYMKMYLEEGETLGNFQKIRDEYNLAYKTRKEKIDTLYNEMSIIKKLKVQ